MNFHVLLPPATKLGQGYIFTGVCDSVHRGGACVAGGGGVRGRGACVAVGACMAGGVCVAGGCAWWGVYVAGRGGVHGGGGGLRDMHGPRADTTATA